MERVTSLSSPLDPPLGGYYAGTIDWIANRTISTMRYNSVLALAECTRSSTDTEILLDAIYLPHILQP